MRTGILMVSIFFMSLPALATDDGNVDAASQEALVKTQAMLRDPDARAKAVNESPQAAFVDHHAQSLGGNAENTNAMYDLSADVLGSLVQQTGGDAAKMKELLDQAKNDPKGFAEKLTPEQSAKLQDISRRIPASVNAAPAAKP